MPDFRACFSIGRDGAFLFLSLSFEIVVFDFLCRCRPKVIETTADEAIGPVANVEYKQLVEKLGGTRKN